MTDRLIQRLVRPNGPNMNGFNGIMMPDDLSEMLDPFFHFDYMGSLEFEGDAIYRALESFADMVMKKEICEVCFEHDDKRWTMFCPIARATENIIFLEDQLSDSPTVRCQDPHDMKNVMKGDEPFSNVVGWLDLDETAFIFAERNAALDFSVRAGLFGTIPVIDRNLDVRLRGGDHYGSVHAAVRRLADIWDQPVSFEGRNGIVTVPPARRESIQPA